MTVRLHHFTVAGREIRVVKDTKRGASWYADALADIGHVEVGHGPTIAAALEAATATLTRNESGPAPTSERPSPHGRDHSRLDTAAPAVFQSRGRQTRRP